MDSITYSIKNRLWITNQNGTYLGEGRIALLQAIGLLGSISQAAKSMNMSYLKAWKLVDSMNKGSKNPLAKKSSGGKGGGGAILTDEGEKAIVIYQKLQDRCQNFLDKELIQIIGN